MFDLGHIDIKKRRLCIKASIHVHFLDILFLNITTITSARSAKITGIWDVSFKNKFLAWMDSSVSYNGASSKRKY